MWIIHEPKKVELWNKRHFEEKGTENLGAKWEWVVNTMLRPLYPRERDTGTQGIEGWVGPRDGSEFDLRTFQPIASRYTNWAIPAHIIL
jgi:hypothetical protein